MRYRIGETPGEIGEPVGHGVIAMAAVFSFLMGIGFVIAGLRSRHYWLSIWGTGLSLSSAAYLVYYSLLL
jgi:hypothetical protein